MDAHVIISSADSGVRAALVSVISVALKGYNITHAQSVLSSQRSDVDDNMKTIDDVVEMLSAKSEKLKIVVCEELPLEESDVGQKTLEAVSANLLKASLSSHKAEAKIVDSILGELPDGIEATPGDPEKFKQLLALMGITPEYLSGVVDKANEATTTKDGATTFIEDALRKTINEFCNDNNIDDAPTLYITHQQIDKLTGKLSGIALAIKTGETFFTEIYDKFGLQVVQVDKDDDTDEDDD